MKGTFGRAFGKIRRQRGWSMERLARALGISTTAVSRWECGRSLPTPERIDQACAVMGVPTVAGYLQRLRVWNVHVQMRVPVKEREWQSYRDRLAAMGEDFAKGEQNGMD